MLRIVKLIVLTLASPMTVVGSIPTTPYFNANTVSFSKKVNATLVFCIVLGLSLFDIFLLVFDKGVEAIPKSSAVLAIYFISIWTLIFLIFNKPRYASLMSEFRGSSVIEKGLSIILGFAFYIYWIFDFLSRRPST